MGFRYVCGGLGVALMAFGGFLLVQQPEPWRIVLWLAGGVLVHDGLIAPLVVAVGALCAAAGLRLRGVPRAALIVAGSLTVIALPPLLRPGGVANASVLPLDYPRNWLLAMVAIAAFTTGHVGACVWARRRQAAARR
ncbi:hypothetical protein DEJ51_01075 [Streptomyces venezuelae]|uniref:Uncharacterized protein n=1 Tax=Streptomyces venezuelae TaxID=54571 RepID=A0A5P2DD69_STRVZ|nr:hypothetical protein [Streptomyces venezuelae]QES53026.1 hypothetical protein DEJ51_01075 [Streptomyces venezuelae]